MALDLSGRIIKILQAQTGESKAGKSWYRQEFVIETVEKYPKKVCMSVMDDKHQIPPVGTLIEAHFNIESREFNEKYYTNVTVWKIVRKEGNDNGNEEFNPNINNDNIPF